MTSPATRRRISLAATINPSRSSPSVRASRTHSSRVSTPPSSEVRTLSSDERTEGETCWHTSPQEPSCSVQRLHQFKSGIISLLSECAVRPPRWLEGCTRHEPGWSAEQISRRGTDNLSSITAPTTKSITTNYTSRNERPFATHKTGHASQFVGNTVLGGMHFVAIDIAMSPIVVDRFHAGHANGHLVQSLAPGAAETVGDDYRNMQRSAFLDLAMNAGGRAIGIPRQQQRGIAAVHIRNVNAAVGTNETVGCLGDEHVSIAHHSLRLAQG